MYYALLGINGMVRLGAGPLFCPQLATRPSSYMICIIHGASAIKRAKQ